MASSREPWTIVTYNWEKREKNQNEEYQSLGDKIWTLSGACATGVTGEEKKSLKTWKSEEKEHSKWDFFQT